MMVRLGRRVLNLLLLTLVSSAGAWAQARFDLPGPRIDIRVTRNGAMLPIASVPNLQAGDKLWLHPDFPADQVAHYLLIASFLRGTTNPPPDDWFTRIETWKKDVREEGVTVTVPEGAQQAILFLAPETGGDYSTLRSAVKGRPGVFVRASQDLTEAGFEQGRIEKYLAAMKQVPPGDPKALQQHSDLLARTLALKPNPDCFKRPLDQQYTCLTQTGTQTLLDDGHSLTVAEALSNGASSDFINAASYTPLAGGGNYSAYVGAIVDLVRLTSSLHVAKYQYIPAIAFPSIDTAQATLDLRLNTAPSFNNPKSVIVIGLPAVRATVAPPLRPVDPKHVSCLLDPDMTLPIEGAPLVFTTSFAHDVVLHLNLASGAKPQDLPLTPDAYKGGLVLKKESGDRKELPPLDASAPAPASQPAAKPVVDDKPGPPARPAAPAQTPVEAPKGTITGTIEGMWGFDRFTGPTLPLQQTEGGNWRIVSISSSSPNASPNTLIVGHPNKVELTASGTACVDTIELEPGDKKIEWKLAAAPDDKSPQPVDLTLNLEHDTAAGSIHLAIHQFGDTRPELLAATTFVEPAKLEALRLHAGDLTAVLTGAGLEQVESVSVRGLTLLPAKNTSDDGKTLALSLPNDAKASALKAGEKLDAEVHLHDGRTLPVKGTVLAPRPAVTILSRRVTSPEPSPIGLTAGDDLPLGSQLIFFLKSRSPFLRMDKIEIASDAPADAGADQELKTTLSVAAGSLTLEDAHTLLVTFDPLKTFGPSTYGPFHLRPVAADGTPGEWIPLATIVRLPTLTALICPVDPTANCQLSGSGLYLIDSISLDPNFSSSVQVPEGFVETAVAVQHPAPGVQPATLYLKLRDDPAKPEPVTLNVQTDTPTPPPARGRHQSGPPAAPSTAAMAPAAAGTGTTGTGTAAAAPVAAAGAVPKL